MITMQKECVFKNIFGELGNMENKTVYKTENESKYFLNSSKYKFGSSSQAWQQSAAASELQYILQDTSDNKTRYVFNPTHKYYFSIWAMKRTDKDMKIKAYWGDTSNIILNNVSTEGTDVWKRHSKIFEFPDAKPNIQEGYNYTFKISCIDYPGNNALINIDGLMLIDLTEACGVGNEPTKEWCDEKLDFTTSTIKKNINILENAAYIGVNNKACKIKDIYIGDENNIAHKIKKIYFGDKNNVAKLIYKK